MSKEGLILCGNFFKSSLALCSVNEQCKRTTVDPYFSNRAWQLTY